MNLKTAITTIGLCLTTSSIALSGDWNGGYIGGQIGWHNFTLDGTATDTAEAPVIVDNGDQTALKTTVSPDGNSATFDFKEDGFVGGIYGGYNIQSGNFLYGIEADISFNSAKKEYSFIEGADSLNFSLKQAVVGTVRGRLGFIQDNILFYGTAGIAFSSLKADLDVSFAGNTLNMSQTESLTGYAVGGGVEYQFAPNMTMKVEYLYTDYGDLDYQVDTATASIDTTSHDIMVGIAYRF